eukprot:1009555-Prorocentrum_lima.AAC.1
MTSSLVGSEMCIRDSFSRPQGLLFPEGVGVGLPAKRQGFVALGSQNPVSYTHLTLPTICSV